MAAKQPVIDPKVRRALMLVGVLLLVVIILAVRNYIATVNERQLVANPVSTDERLVVIDGDTMLVEPEALGEAMTAWLKSRKGKTLSFELSDRSFRPNSAAPSSVTATRIGQVAGLTKASPTLTVHILQPLQSDSVRTRKLDEQRALRLRDALVASGVNKTQVTVEVEREGLPTENSPHLAVLLTK
jgi:hypothetical protein